MRQYEIWWADMPVPVGRRPVLLLSRDAAYEYLDHFIVVEVTSTIRSIPVEVDLGRAEGLRRRSVANFDNLHVVSKKRLVSRIGTLRATRVAEVKRALGYALGWTELKLLEA
ncbi:MAG: type II toxin-antitoxin system PemK/MazF family toxin [Thermoanaerobaculia bacterium]